jgi:Ca-activated chloride channel family protein
VYRIIALGFFAALTTAALGTPEQHRTPPRPLLMAEWGSSSEPLRLRTVAVDTRIVGHLAETRTTLTFHNPRPRPLVGAFYFPLPAKATLSGYAIDVDGRMIDAVVVEKRDTPQVFTSETEAAVDFGMTESMQGNQFITRVSPIPAGGSRTIMVRFVSNLIDTAEDESVYRLPLGFHDHIDELSLRVEVVNAASPPRVIEAAGLVDLRFTDRGDNFLAEQKFATPDLSGDLVIALPDFREHAVQIERASDNQIYFLIRDPMTAPPTEHPNSTMERIRVLWDTSGSRAGADVEREISLLTSYLSTPAAAGAEIELQPFAIRAAKIERFQMPGQLDALITTVRNLQYDGGTQIGALGILPGEAPPDEILLFSDGVHDFGSDDATELNAPVYAIGSSPVANRAWLRDIARRTDGRDFDLNQSSDAEVIAAIGRAEVRFLSLTATAGAVGDTDPGLRSIANSSFTVVGRLLGEAAAVTLEYGIGDRVLERRQFSLRREDAVQGDLIARHWASRKLAELRAFPQRNHEEIVELGKHYSIVTPETALVVLEEFEDYLAHRTRPPAALPEMRVRYDSQIEQLGSPKTEGGSSKIERVLALWEERVAWWKTDFEYPGRFRFRPPEHNGANSEQEVNAQRNAAPVGVASAGTFSEQIVAGLGILEVASLDLIGLNLEIETREEELEPTVRFEPWNPETPYLAALLAVPPARRFDLYLEQKAAHGRSPGFFLDCADFFHEQGEPQLALQVLSNVAELEIEDPLLIRVVAHRLVRLEQLDLAVLLFKELVELRPREPQSFRDLALVLAQRAGLRSGDAARGDYERALGLLAHVVMNDWNRNPEIEVIALMELNRMFPLARSAGVKALPLDERLIEPLDVDIRIVMSWDAPSTDMDIHVIEPSGEEAFSRHDLTTIGGRVSRDVTDGYGPEVYLVRNAMRGTYRIESEFLGSPAAELIGAVTLQVDIFTNYGRHDEERESVTLRLTEPEERLTIAEFEF